MRAQYVGASASSHQRRKRFMSHSRTLALLALALLPACSSGTVKNTLGLERAAPDEFRVVSRPPLSVPPQFNLRPPANGEAAPGQTPASKQAEALMRGQSAPGGEVTLTPGSADTAVVPVTSSSMPSSSAESEFLKRAGADKADRGVRDKLAEDHMVRQQEEEDASWWDILSTSPKKKDPMVNAKKESDRIQKNEEEGKPVNEGDTPEVKDKDTGVLGRILGD